MADRPTGDDPLHLVGAAFIGLALKWLWTRMVRESNSRPKPDFVPIPHTAGEMAALRAELDIQQGRLSIIETQVEEILRLLKARAASTGD